jgi:hypothetical protein
MSVRLRVNWGDEFTFDVTVTKNGEPFDLTGSRVHFALKRGLQDPDPALIEVSTVFGGITVLDAKKGEIRIILKPEDTRKLKNLSRHYVFDIRVREPDGSIFTVLCGELIFKGSVRESSLG